ncbi:winged helix-turn-helix transcriptional regulator [Zavarzinia sp.]|uniref:winged helix-turn-helix transcriptional regulator n=1 Tax=Zavarzinia sp. TaxID=2027920 RepID=UPI00356597CB
MIACQAERFAADCPSRAVLDQIADKWSVMVLAVLDAGPQRFNAIKRRLEGVTQKALTQCLRRLERNGLVTRRVLPLSPVAVEYEITALGRTLQPPFLALYRWILDHMHEIEAARNDFDGRQTAQAA